MTFFAALALKRKVYVIVEQKGEKKNKASLKGLR